MIVADTGAIVALIDRSDRHHAVMMELYAEPSEWVLPWAILPEVNYLVAKYLGPRAEEAFIDDLAGGAFRIEWGQEADLDRARTLARRHRALRLGLVDASVIAVAERLGAEAIATLDIRDFSAVAIKGSPALLPRDR